MNADIEVEVVYAAQARQARYAVKMQRGATVREAIEASGALSDFPEVDLGRNRVGIYGRLVQLSTVLSNGDRVEILRPLAIDPKEARRLRAARKPAR